MERRSFLQTAALAIAALAIDPEETIWKPVKKIFIPSMTYAERGALMVTSGSYAGLHNHNCGVRTKWRHIVDHQNTILPSGENIQYLLMNNWAIDPIDKIVRMATPEEVDAAAAGKIKECFSANGIAGRFGMQFNPKGDS